jgi:septum formation protein
MEPIILASASPRRAELLRQIDYDPIVLPAHIDEEAIRRERAADLVQALAKAKLEAVCKRLSDQSDPRIGHMPVLAADTVVTQEGRILEKPAHVQDAREMLALLSGTAHTVVTGIAVRVPQVNDQTVEDGGVGAARNARHIGVAFAETIVTFADMTEPELEWYLDSEEWRDVAGAYRIQGRAARFITSIEGSYSNVVGLPLHLVYSILRDQRP